LKKIAITTEGSTLEVANKQEVAHMLFGEAGSYSALFATHPPLLDRIRALEPGFREEELQQLAMSLQRGEVAASASAQVAARTPVTPRVLPGSAVPPVLAPVFAGAAVASREPIPAADPGMPDFQRARVLHRSLPDNLTLAVQQPVSALPVVLALACSAQAALQARQWRLIADHFGDDVQHATAAVFSDVETLAPELRLPLAALAFPVLKLLPEGNRQTLLDTLDALVRVDGQVDLDEYCLTRLLRVQLSEAQQPRRAPVDGLKKLPACRDSVALVCAVMALQGGGDEASSRRAWLLAMQQAFPGAASVWQAPPIPWQLPFEQALDDLDGLMPAAKDLLIQSLACVVHADGVVSAEEAALLRVICASLHCPLPM
jgi:hypothetical protein